MFQKLNATTEPSKRIYLSSVSSFAIHSMMIQYLTMECISKLTRYPAKIQVNGHDICWTSDLIEYLAQLARNFRKTCAKDLWSHGITNPNPAYPKTNPILCRRYFWAIHVTSSQFLITSSTNALNGGCIHFLNA